MPQTRRDIEPEGVATRRDVEPEGVATRRDAEDDVEGHSMLISPTISRDLAKAKSADIERSVRGKNLETEAKRVFHK